ncbi:MAG: PDDEXK nuclease domain-containing protein [Armatimonadota bacterium]
MKKKKSSLSVIDRKDAPLLSKEYVRFLNNNKEKIISSRIRAASAANRVLLALYWNIGREIVSRQERLGWGESIIERLSSDIKKEFSDIEGFSTRNLWRMKAFYNAYREEVPQSAAESFEFLPQVVAEIPWGHHALLLEKVKNEKIRIWYAQKTLEYGWSRDVMWHQIETSLCQRQGKALTNFKHTLPPLKSDLAKQALKDPYLFNFLSLDKEYREKELENALIENIEQFLLELGAGFCLVGRQVRLKVGQEDFYIDLLFYHLKLRCFIVIELKTEPFKPEHAGKINFYLAAVDDIIRQPQDNPSIGLILCRTKQALEVEYALRNIKTPIGVAGWQTKLVKKLPKQYRSSLPSVKELETELFRKTKKERKK